MRRGKSSGERSGVLAVILGLALAGLAAWVLEARRHRPARRAAPDSAPGSDLDKRLDEAIEESFPASDPIAINIE